MERPSFYEFFFMLEKNQLDQISLLLIGRNLRVDSYHRMSHEWYLEVYSRKGS